MTTLAGVPNGVEDFAREIRFSSCKSFGCKILVSNSFGYKILRGEIFSVRLFSIFCRGDGEGVHGGMPHCLHLLLAAMNCVEQGIFRPFLGCKSRGMLSLHISHLDGRICEEFFSNTMILKNRVGRGVLAADESKDRLFPRWG